MNHASATIATIESVQIVPESNQSSCCPRSSTYCSDARPAVSNPSPTQSTPPFGFSKKCGFGMNISVIKNAAMPIGMLM